MPSLFVRAKNHSGWCIGALWLASAAGPCLAQQYVFAPSTDSGIDGWVAGWMSNRPPGTLTQDWYPGSAEGSTGATPVSGPTHDSTFLSSTGPQRFGAGLSASPDPIYPDFQVISGLANNTAAAAIAAQQYIEFPFTTGTMQYADATASAALFYVNTVVTAKRWNLNNNAHPRAFGYAAYVVDAGGSPVGTLVQQIDDVSTVSGGDFQLVRPPDGPGPGITLQPGTPYALRFYLYRTATNTDGRASWDDTLFTMSRQTLAEIIVSASAVAAVPAGAQNNYSYSFNVYNNGPDATRAVVSDPLPTTANGATANWSCTLQPSGAPCTTASGSGPISAVVQALNSGETAVYTVTWTGPGITAASTHTVTAQPQAGSPADPISTNNTADLSLVPPTITAQDDGVTLTSNTASAATPVATNDSSTGGVVDPASVTLVTPPTAGSVSCTAGVCTYVPPAGGLTSPVSYQYNICLAAPNQAVCATATVRVSAPQPNAVAATPTPVPTLGAYSLSLLAVLLGWFGIRQRRHRYTR